MTRIMELAAAGALAAAIGYVAGAARPASAAANPEHKVILVEFEDYKDLDEYTQLEKDLKSPWKAQFAFQEAVLKRAGDEGWELIQVVVPKSPATSVFYLRKGAR